jgi:hypothetical protein
MCLSLSIMLRRLTGLLRSAVGQGNSYEEEYQNHGLHDDCRGVTAVETRDEVAGHRGGIYMSRSDTVT